MSSSSNSGDNTSPTVSTVGVDSRPSQYVSCKHYSSSEDNDDTHTYYILSRYCLPIQSTNHLSCRFMARYCLFNKHKLCSEIPDTPNESLTVTKLYTQKPTQTKYDCRLLKCFNSKCSSNPADDIILPRIFHFCCYNNMIERSDNDKSFSHLKVDRTNVSRVFSNESIERPIVDNVLKFAPEIILPICSKRCYNSVKNLTNIDGTIPKQKKKIKQSESNWDNDGGPDCRSSEKVIVDWLTDEKNNRLYFGGTGSNGNTNGKTKKQYHKELQMLIFKENGKFICFFFKSISSSLIFYYLYI